MISKKISKIFSKLNYFEYNYEKMATKLMKNLQRIFIKIKEKDIDIFEKGLEEMFKKRRHQDGLKTKLPEAHKDCIYLVNILIKKISEI